MVKEQRFHLFLKQNHRAEKVIFRYFYFTEISITLANFCNILNMNLVSDCNGLTQDVSKDEWELRSSETPKESKQEISMLRSCFEKGNHFINYHKSELPNLDLI